MHAIIKSIEYIACFRYITGSSLEFENGLSVPICSQPHRYGFPAIHILITISGYTRVIMAIAAYYYISNPATFLPLYMISCLLDAVDGHAARFLGQSTH